MGAKVPDSVTLTRVYYPRTQKLCPRILACVHCDPLQLVRRSFLSFLKDFEGKSAIAPDGFTAKSWLSASGTERQTQITAHLTVVVLSAGTQSASQPSLGQSKVSCPIAGVSPWLARPFTCTLPLSTVNEWITMLAAAIWSSPHPSKHPPEIHPT